MNSSLPNNAGFLYVATQPHHVEEAARSWASVRAEHPEAKAVIHTDCPEKAAKHFPEVRLLENPTETPLDKIAPMAQSPFSRTLFLDTDTLVLGNLSGLFEMLNLFDLLVARDPWAVPEPGTPDALRQYNTGVLAYRGDQDAVQEFFREWDRDYRTMVAEEGRYTNDQRSFQRLIGGASFRWFTLGEQYNLRTNAPALLRPMESAVVLHGRRGAPEGVAPVINLNPHGFRIFFPSLESFASVELVLPDRAERKLLRILLLPLKIWFRIRRRWEGRNTVAAYR